MRFACLGVREGVWRSHIDYTDISTTKGNVSHSSRWLIKGNKKDPKTIDKEMKLNSFNLVLK